MNCPDDTPPGGLRCYPDDMAGMFIDYSNNDLFDLVWQRQGGGGGGDLMMEQAAVSGNTSPQLFTPPPVHEPDEVLLPDPPSEDEMASWLSAIVKGEEHAREGGGDGSGCTPPPEKQFVVVPPRMGTKDTAGESSEKAAAGGSRRSHHGGTHNLTKKRRRCKINERLKKLQQLVPGCDKSNHASTLEQTIQYMKWLQHQAQAMSVGATPVRPPAATTTAVYPVAQPPSGVAPAVLGPLPMILFRPLMPCAVHYTAPAVLVPAAAAAPPLYTAPAPAISCSGAKHRRGSNSRVLKLKGGRTSSMSVRHRA